MTPDDLVVTSWYARFRGRCFPCATGRGGIGPKTREGDGVTPEGTYRLVGILTRPDRARLVGTPIGLRDAWCDDPAAPSYNRLVLRDGPGTEKLRRPDPLYDLIGVLDFNMDPVTPGLGSAIFLHGWRKPRHPTAGCIAFARNDLRHILSHWTPRSRIVIRGR